MKDANSKAHQYKKISATDKPCRQEVLQSQKMESNLHSTKQMQTKNAATTNKMLKPQEIGARGKTLQLEKPTANMKCCKLAPQIGSTLDYKGLPGTQRKC